MTSRSAVSRAPVPTELDEYRLAFREWLGVHRDEFERVRATSFAEHMDQGLSLIHI